MYEYVNALSKYESDMMYDGNFTEAQRAKTTIDKFIHSSEYTSAVKNRNWSL